MTSRPLAVPVFVAALMIGAAIALTPTGLFRVYPAIVYIAELSGWPLLVVPLAAAGLFILWNLPLLTRNGDAPKSVLPWRSHALGAIGLVLSLTSFILQWSWAERYIPSDLYTAAFLSGGVFVLVVVAAAVAVRKRAIIANLVTHILLFLWLFIFAIPFLSEPCC